MIIRKNELKEMEIDSLRGGDGKVYKTVLVNGDEGYGQRLYSVFRIPQSSSIGKHTHNGEVEYYTILSGEGVVTDDSGEKEVYPGDTIVTGNGESHSIRNNKEEDLVFFAVILKERR